MRIPFVIDNEHTTAADVLNTLLAASEGCPLDIATAYFTIPRNIRQSVFGLPRSESCHLPM